MNNSCCSPKGSLPQSNKSLIFSTGGALFHYSPKTKLLLLFFLFCFRLIPAQISVDPGNTLPLTADNIIQNVFLGEGVEIVDVKFFGESTAVGVFENGMNNIGLNRGIVMSTGLATDVSRPSKDIANQDSSQESLHDEDLAGLLVNNIDLVDIVKYEITFRPAADSIMFRYVFASDEYPEFVCSSTNDVFGFFITGPNPAGGNYQNKNIALVPDPADPFMNTFLDIPVSVNNVNAGMPGPQYNADPYCLPPLGSLDYGVYYNEVSPDQAPIYNAYLDVFEAKAHVVPCATYTIKMAIADGRLGDYDSAVFLEEKSFSTNTLLINVNNPGVDGGISEGCQPGSIDISLSGPTSVDFPIQIDVLMDIDPSRSAEEGLDFMMVDRNLFIPKGMSTVKLNLIPLQDNMEEDTEYIHLQIRTDICNVDTIIIPLFDNSLNGIQLIDSLFTCEQQGKDVIVDLGNDITITDSQTFNSGEKIMNAPGDSIIESIISVSGIEKEMLEKNMIESVCIDTLIHQRLNDLDIYLRAPSGQLLELSTDNGSRPNNEDQPDTLINTCFTIFTAATINNGNSIEGPIDFNNPNYSGLFLPEGNMDKWLFPFESSSNGNYTLVIVDDQGATFPTTLCGWHITFRPTYQIFYNWSPSENINCPICPEIRLRPDSSQYYFLNLRDSYGCVKTDSLWVEAYPRPEKPIVSCDSTGVSELNFSWTDVADAVNYEFRINGRFPWLNASSSMPFFNNGIEIQKGIGNSLHLNGFLPEEQVSIIFRAVNQYGCVSGNDTIYCITDPCPTQNPVIDSIYIDQPICDSDGNAYLQIFADDDDLPLNYRVILPSVTARNQTGIFFSIPQGNWPFRVIDALGCGVEDTLKINDPPPVEILESLSPISCFNASDAAIDLLTEGTVGDIAIQWSTGDTLSSINGLSSGSYSVTVTDSLGCSENESYTIDNPEELVYEAILIDSIGCDGSSSALIQLDASGGVMPYNITWSNHQNGAFATTTTSGYLSYSILDANACFKTDSILVLQDTGFEVELINQSSIQCFTDSTGMATISAIGGSPPYQYIWDNGETSASPTALHAGDNFVTITDSRACVVTLTVFFDSPDPILLMGDPSLPSCAFGQDGSLAISISGGISDSGNYSVFWDNGATQAINSDIPAGIYCVTVSDDVQCQTSQCFELQDMELISSSASIVPSNCDNSSEGAIDIAAVGGSGSYNYVWSGPHNFNSTLEDISGLLPGNYFLTIQDASVFNCQQEFEYVVNSQSALEASIVVQENIECHGGDEGLIVGIAGNGNPPYSYSWSSNVSNMTDSIAYNLAAGTYSLSVEDASGCVSETVFDLVQPTPLNISLSQNELRCAMDSTGMITANITGGTSPYQYDWLNQNTQSASISGLSAGSYTIQVTDAMGCTIDASTELIANEAPILLELIIEDVSCYNNGDGSITIFVENGPSPLQYSLNGVDYQSGNSFKRLQPGQYTIHVIDGNSCESFATAEITEPQSLKVDAGEDQSVEYGASVNLMAEVQNQKDPVEWVWTSSKIADFDCPVGCSDPTVHNITKSFSAKVHVLDFNGCSAEDFVSITVFEENQIFVPTGFTPNNDGNNDVLRIYGSEEIYILRFNIYSRWGELVFSASDYNIKETQIAWDGLINGEPANQGNYTWSAEYQLPSSKIYFSSGQIALFR